MTDRFSYHSNGYLQVPTRVREEYRIDPSTEALLQATGNVLQVVIPTVDDRAVMFQFGFKPERWIQSQQFTRSVQRGRFHVGRWEDDLVLQEQTDGRYAVPVKTRQFGEKRASNI